VLNEALDDANDEAVRMHKVGELPTYNPKEDGYQVEIVIPKGKKGKLLDAQWKSSEIKRLNTVIKSKLRRTRKFDFNYLRGVSLSNVFRAIISKRQKSATPRVASRL
jgi:hypothetical protein